MLRREVPMPADPLGSDDPFGLDAAACQPRTPSKKSLLGELSP
jgi:hypothetical protein